VAKGKLVEPQVWDALLKLLWERGSAHEQEYEDHLIQAGINVVSVDRATSVPDAETQTLAAMRAGAPVIVQGSFTYGGWTGRPDILRRVEVPSALGSWSYEPLDTKLARETKAGTILQLCLYCDLLRIAQGTAPQFMYVVAPWTDFQPQQYRFTDYAAFFRKAKPTPHCDICRWRIDCDQRRRADDHLSLVANITKIQINELRQHGINTTKDLAGKPKTQHTVTAFRPKKPIFVVVRN